MLYPAQNKCGPKVITAAPPILLPLLLLSISGKIQTKMILCRCRFADQQADINSHTASFFIQYEGSIYIVLEYLHVNQTSSVLQAT